MNFRFIKQTVLILLLLPTFVLANEVDLSLEVTSPQGEQTIGTTVPFYFHITNNSNTTATNVVFENDFSSNLHTYAPTSIANKPNLTYISANSSQGDCSLNEYIIICDIGVVSSSDTLDISIEMRIEYVGELNMSASISSEQSDTNILNNSGKAIIIVSKENIKAYAELISHNPNLPSFYKGNSTTNSISSNGKIISFASFANLTVETNNDENLPPESTRNKIGNIFTIDRNNSHVQLVSSSNISTSGNKTSGSPSISNDGDLISFISRASDLISNDTNGIPDAFVYKRSTGEIYRLSVSDYGQEANGKSVANSDISANGKYIVFTSDANNLTPNDTNNTSDIFIHNTETRTLSRIDIEQSNIGAGILKHLQNPSISGNGTYIAFSARINAAKPGSRYPVFLWNKNTGQIKEISISKMPNGANVIHATGKQVSDNGKYVTYFAGSADYKYEIFRYNIETEETELISNGIKSRISNGSSYFPSISENGRFIVFNSSSSNLVENDNNEYIDIFVFDSESKTTKLVSKGVGGFPAKNSSMQPAISADGTTISFWSKAHNLTLNDGDNITDVFVANNPFLTEPAKQVDLSIEKSASASEIEIGKNITYTLTVDNISVDPEAIATGVTVEDVLPTGLTFDSVIPTEGVTCTENSGTVSCDLGDIAVDDPSISIEIVAKTTAKGEIKNTATVTAAETDSDTSNNSSAATIAVIEPTDVYIDGSIDDSVTYYIGDELTYSFAVGNNSDNPATDVTAIITLPTTFSSITASTDVDNSTCSVNDTKITCIFGDDIEQTDKANIIVKATPSAAGDFDVDAQVTTAKTDSDNDNNSDTATVAVKPKSDLAISIEDSDDPDGSIYAGTNLTYTITVKNNGPSDATNIKITDTLPTGVTFVSASSSCAHAAGEVICNIDDIANGASKSVSVVIKPTTPGTITNNASVSATGYDPVAANNTASESTVVNAVADLSITMTDSSDPIYAGSNLTYTLKITNNGINDASSVKVNDTLPSGVTFISASAGCSEAAGTVTCNAGNLANGASTSIDVVIKPTAPGTITNSASVSATGYDPVAANNTASEATAVNAVTDMEIVTASANPTPVYAGANLTYDVTIRNNAAEFNTATGVKVTYTFSDNIVLDSASSCTAVGNIVTCDVSDMVYNTTKDIQLVIQPDMDGDLEADIEVISITHDPDTSEDSNSKSITTAVTPAVDIVVTMLESADPILVGQDLTYTITVTNNGPSTAINVVLQDILPAAAPVQSFVTSQGTCINNLTTFDCDIGDLANDDSVKITLVLRPTNGAAGTLINEANVSSDVYERPTTPDNNVALVSTIVNQSSKLKVSLKGKGSGTVTGAGISCPEDCEEVFTRGDKVILTASPISSFDRWQGGVCSGKNHICEFTLDKPNMNVMASFK